MTRVQRPLAVLLVSFFALVGSVMSASEFVGNWRLASATTDAGEALDTTVDDFVFKVSDGDTPRHLGFSFRVGNNMSTRAELGENGDSISFGMVRSTRMAVPEDRFRLANFLSDNLPKMTTIAVQDDTMTIAGSGEIILKK